MICIKGEFVKTKKILGLGLLLLACVVGYMGYSESQGIGSSLSSALNGSPSDNVMIKYIIAAVLAGVGVFLIKK